MQSKKSIIENILKNKSLQNDKPGPGVYSVEGRKPTTPVITSVFVSKTPKLNVSRAKWKRSASFKNMMIGPKRNRTSRSAFHLDLNHL